MSYQLIFDVETDGLIPEATKVHCIVAYNLQTQEITRFNDQGVGRTLAEGLRYLSEADTLIGHNILDFDIPVLRKLYPQWHPQGKVFDTLVLTRLVWADLKNNDFSEMHNTLLPTNMIGSHSLKAWGYRIGELKGNFMEQADDYDEWSVELEEYCEQDVRVTVKLFNTIFTEKKPDMRACRLEHDFARVIRRQEQRGFAFDVDAAENLVKDLQIRRVELQEELQSIFQPTTEKLKSCNYLFQEECFDKKANAVLKAKEWARAEKEAGRPITQAKAVALIEKGANKIKTTPFNCGSRDQIVQRFKDKYGWKPKESTDGGKAKLNEAVLRELDYPEAKPLLEYLLVSKRLSQIAEGREAWLSLVKADGRIHGRVKTNGAVTGRCTHSNPNMAQVPRVGSAYGEECRSLFVAAEGFKLVGCDASGLELRCLAHFMAKYDNGRYVRELLEGDIHTINQKAAGLPTRDAAKTFIYAFLYGAGDEKIGSIIDGDAASGNKLKKRFLDKTPALKQLKRDIQEVSEHRGHLIGLDGRELPVRFKHAALNTLLQSAGALVMKKATVIFDEARSELGIDPEDVGLVAHVHDEMQIEVKSHLVQPVMGLAKDSVKYAGRFFSLRCPLAAEAKAGISWADTH